MSDTAATSTQARVDRRWWAPLVVAAAFFATLAIPHGGGVFGSDEYWYAGDLRMSAATGAAVTNHIYPLVAEASAPGTLPARMHNVPVTYVADGVFRALGGGAELGAGPSPGVAWFVVNLLLALATAAVIGRTARAVGGSGSWGPAAFLLFPTTMWATLDPLAEMSLAFGVAVLVGACVAAESGRRYTWWLVAALTVLGLLWTRANFVVVLVAFVGWLAWSWRRGRASGRATPAITAGLLAAAATLEAAVPTYPNAGLAATLMVGAAGASSNMDFYSTPVPFDAAAFVDKLLRGTWQALTPSTPAQALPTVPIAVAILGGLVATRRVDTAATGRDLDTIRVVRFWGVVLLLTYVATCAVFQPQVRYLYAAAPVAAILLDVTATRLVRRDGTHATARRIGVGLTAIALGTAAIAQSTQTARTVRIVSANADAATARLATALAPALTRDAGPLKPAVMVITHGNAADIAIAYAAIPHPTLSIDPKLIPVEQARSLARSWNVTAFVGTGADTAYVHQIAEGRSLRAPTTVAGTNRRATTTVWLTD